MATTYLRGGAANSLRLLHEALLEQGHDSRVLSGRESVEEARVGRFPPIPLWGRVPYHGLNLLGLNYTGIPNTGSLARHPWFQQADVVHYHNLHGGYFNYLALPKLTAAKPSVWTLRDMWAFTGHCAHSFDCQKWKQGCGGCPYLKTDPPVRRDATRWEWKLKQRVYAKSNIVVTAPSQWLANLARGSLLGRFPVLHVPNAVRTERFTPGDKSLIRKNLGWPLDKFGLIFAAESMHNPFKNFAMVVEALGALSAKQKPKVFLAVLGDTENLETLFPGIQIFPLGYVRDDSLVADYFKASDVFVYPTRADNQPRVLLESMACETPPVSTAVGGVPELVTPETGWLADDGDAENLRLGIVTLMDNPEKRRELAANGRSLVLREHGVDLHVQRMLGVYERAVAG